MQFMSTVLCYLKGSESCSVVSNSLRPHGLHRPWNSPGQSPGVGSVSLLQGSFPIQESNWDLLHCRQILYQLSYQGSLMLLNTHVKQKQTILLSLVKSLYTLLSDVIISIVGPRHLLLGQFNYWFLLIMLISGRKNVTFSVHCLREKNSQNKWLKMKKINQQYCYLIHKITPTTNLPT